MKSSLSNKLTQLATRREELDGLLAEPDVTRDLDRYRALSREHAEIDPVVALYRDWQQAERELANARELAFGLLPIAIQCDDRVDLRMLPRHRAIAVKITGDIRLSQ